MRSFSGKNNGDRVHHRMSPSVGDISAIGIAPDGKSSGGCVSEHRSGFSDIHSVNSSINESGGVAKSPPFSLKYKSDTAVMKLTANLGATIGRDFS